MNLNLKKKKLAFSFNDFANFELNNFISRLSSNNDVTLFSNQKYQKRFFKKKIKFVFLEEKKNYLIDFFKIFSKTNSSSLQNFYYIENIINKNFILKILLFFKFLLSKIGLLVNINTVRKFLPEYEKNFPVYDYIITDFRFNEVYTNHSIINIAKKKNIPIIVLLFSWDNLYSEDINLEGDFYFVSSSKMKKILNLRHNIALTKIFFHNSFQYSYVLKKNTFNKKKKYILYSCCVEENSKISNEEFEIINHIGKLFIDNNISYKVLVRPYPFFQKKINLENKIKYPNIFIKDYGKIKKRKKIKNNIIYMRYEKNNKDKMKLLSEAKCHINILSTIGIESMLLKTDTIFLNLEKKFSITNLREYFESNYFKSKFLDHFKIFKKKKLFIENISDLDRILLRKLKNNNKIPTHYKFFKNFFLTK